ncbi:MAG: tetratricopeptide repeat protein [Deltaproteobacteria bacterium]
MSNARFAVIPLALALLVAAPLARATPEVWARSYSLETQGNSRGALEALESLPEAEHAGYLFTLRHGWLLYLAGRYDASVAAYRQAAALTTESLEAPLGELLPLLALRRWSEAEQRARAVLARDADNYLATRRLALALFGLGRFDDAEQAYRAVSRRYPSDLEMLSGIAWCQARRGHRDEAAAMFRSVLAVNPEDTTARAGLTAMTTAEPAR